MLEVKDLSVRFNNPVLVESNFFVRDGEIVGLIGRNGTGKTTFMKAIANLIGYDGDISYDGSLGLMVESQFLDYMTAYDNVKLLNKVRGENVDLNDWFSKLDLYEHRNKKFKQYSLGMKQRLLLLQAICGDNNLLLLDEPFNGLDPIGREVFLTEIKKMKENGKSIVISSHNIHDIYTLCDRVYMIHDKRIVEVEKKEKYKIECDNVPSLGINVEVDKNTIKLKIGDGLTLDSTIKMLHEKGCTIVSIEKVDNYIEIMEEYND